MKKLLERYSGALKCCELLDACAHLWHCCSAMIVTLEHADKPLISGGSLCPKAPCQM